MAQVIQLRQDERSAMVEHFMNRGATVCLEIQRMQSNMPTTDTSPFLVEMWCKELACLGAKAECYAEIINLLKGAHNA